jgi:hypothetical protein
MNTPEGNAWAKQYIVKLVRHGEEEGGHGDHYHIEFKKG